MKIQNMVVTAGVGRIVKRVMIAMDPRSGYFPFLGCNIATS